MNTVYHLPMRARLEPLTPWRGGRMSETAVLTLKEAARFASKHANTKIKPADFLRAAGLGEIVLRAICPRTVTMQPCRETDEPLAVPENSIPTLPLDACKAIANTGLAQWRTYEGFEPVAAFGGELCRFIRWQLPDEEPDLVTTPAECRVLGRDVHALADAFIDMPSVPATAPATEAPPSTRQDDDDDESVTPETTQDTDATIAALFDPVGTSQLERMFPAAGQWSKWADRAARNDLKVARVGRARFNPVRAAQWWLGRHASCEWDWARCCRVLANNLPPQSIDSRHLLTGKYE